MKKIQILNEPVLEDDGTELTSETYWGVCPTCKCNDGYVNIGKGHWFYCKEHKVRWFIGRNLFSDWRCETEEEQRKIYDGLGFGTFQTIDCREAK